MPGVVENSSVCFCGAVPKQTPGERRDESLNDEEEEEKDDVDEELTEGGRVC
jgi:hypothetical protein